MARSAKSRSHPPGYFPALTGLRALAAGLVFVHHLAQVPGNPFSFTMWGEGYVGVSIFFTLSGYLITKTYLGGFATGNTRFWDYWFRRFARIYPVYAIALTAKLAWIGASRYGLAAFLAMYSVTQGFFGVYRFIGLGPAWSLTVEESFYLLAPLVFLALSRPRGHYRKLLQARGRMRALIVLGAIGAGLWCVGLVFQHVPLPGYFLYTRDQMALYSIFGRFTEFGLGILTALVLHWGVKERRGGGDVRADVGFVLSLGVIVFGMEFLRDTARRNSVDWGVSTLEGFWGLWIASVGTVLLIASIVRGSRLGNAVLGNRVIEYLGRASYALYLLQDLDTIQTANAWLLVRWQMASSWGRSLLLFALFNAAAALLYEFVEKPIHRALLRWKDSVRVRRKRVALS